ncbi:hypothetical protein HMPREF1502_5743 [Klebsiella sp. AS10]|nr:hypothetical protein HMPREF1502_5743 [Klebsiella sp. AS10]
MTIADAEKGKAKQNKIMKLRISTPRDMSRYLLFIHFDGSLQRNDVCIAEITKLSAELTR